MGGRRWVWILALGSSVWTGGCGAGPAPAASVPSAWAPTLLVESTSGDHVAVRVNGRRVGTITRGRTCIAIPAVAGSLTIDFVALGGSARTPEPLHLTRGNHWHVRIGPMGRLEDDLLSLRRTDSGCMPGRPSAR